MTMLLLQMNPLTPLSTQGWAVGSAIICTGLFIWAQIEAYKTRKATDSLVTTFSACNAELKEMLTTQAKAQTGLAGAVNNLAHAMSGQADMHREQLDLIREVMSEQKLQSAQMMTITNGFQRVVEQLITVVKGKD
jgi:type I site-specific restriction endonuclease